MTNSEHIPNGQDVEDMATALLDMGCIADPQMRTRAAFMLVNLLALTRRSSAGVKVKALEWTKHNVDGTFWSTQVTICGEYKVKFDGHAWEAWVGMLIVERAETCDAAKASAFSHYRSRILSTIEPVTTEGEAVAWMVVTDVANSVWRSEQIAQQVATSVGGTVRPLYLRPSPSVPPQGETSERRCALAIVAGRGVNLPDPDDKDGRIIGWKVPYSDTIGLGTALFGLDYIRKALASQTQGEGAPRLITVRAHKPTCPNVQPWAGMDDKCNCGALDTAGNAIELTPAPTLEPSDAEVERRGIYVASKVAHAEMWRDLRHFEQEPIISTWIDEAGVGESASLEDLWRRCVHEASTAAALIIYRRPDEVLKGAWVELGAALASGVPVFAVGIEEFTVANHAGITHCENLIEARKLARALIASRQSTSGEGV